MLKDYTKKELAEMIDNSLLTVRERKIIEYRWGLDDGASHTLEETGKLFGVTRERIRQIENGAVEKLKRSVIK